MNTKIVICPNCGTEVTVTEIDEKTDIKDDLCPNCGTPVASQWKGISSLLFDKK